MVAELVKTCFGRGERDLLFENDIEQSRKPFWPCPKRRRAVGSMNKRQSLVRSGEFAADRRHVQFAYGFDFCHYANTISAKQSMDIIQKIATSLNRRDEVPNQELAAEIVI